MADDTATMDDVLAEFRENGWNAGIVKNDAGIECLIIDGKPLGSMDWVSKHPRRLINYRDDEHRGLSLPGSENGANRWLTPPTFVPFPRDWWRNILG